MTTMHSRLGWLVCALVLAVLAAPGPGGSQSNPNAELVVGGGETNPVLDPHAEISAFGHHYKMAVFDGLTYIDGKGEVHPALAASWSNPSPTTWEFRLRPGVKFASGTPLTAEDVVFSLRRILDPATKSLVAGRIATVERVEASGDLGVRVTTKGPDPILPRRLAIAYVIDDAAFQKAPASEPLAQFVGTGPFKVTAFQRGQRVVFERVDASWRGKPDLARITLLAMPEVSTRVAALRSGQVDVIVNLPADQIQPLQSGGYEVVTALTGRTCGIMMNTRHGPPLANRLVRQALNYAIDKDTIVKNILHGVGAVAQGQLVGPDGFGHNPAVKAYPYDPAKAKALLAQAGYPNGFTHKLIGSKGLFGNDFVMQQALVGMLAEVGVKADLVIEETSLWRSNNNNGLHKDLLFTCLQYFPAMDADFVLQLFKSSHAYRWYENAAFEKAFDESRVLLDPKRRLQKLHEVAQILHEDPPLAYLYQEPVTFAHAKHVTGVTARPDQVLWFDPIKKRR
jgi:peptide/nickel transport system substrate-binding protein